MPHPIPLLPAVYCKNCETLIGFYMQIGNQVWLQVGTLQLREVYGRCCHCNTEYHWIASSQAIEVLIGRKFGI